MQAFFRILLRKFPSGVRRPPEGSDTAKCRAVYTMRGTKTKACYTVREAYSIPLPNRGAKTTATMVISLMSMLIEGPEVSLKGSPTVSPTTAAL